MPQAVKLPDGSLVNFPDDMSPEDITSAMPKVWEQAQVKMKPPEKPGVLARIGSTETQELAKSADELASPNFADKPSDPWYQKAVAFVGQKAGAVGGALMSPFKSVAKETVGEGVADTVSNAALSATTQDHPELASGMTPTDRALMMDKLHDTSKEAVGGAVSNAAMATIGLDKQTGGFKSVKDIRNRITGVDTKLFGSNSETSGGIRPPAAKPEDFDVLAEANKKTGVFAQENDPSVSGLKANQAISKAHNADKIAQKDAYTQVNREGSVLSIKAPELYQKLSNITAYLKDKVALGTDEHTALTELSEIEGNLKSKYSVEDVPSKTSNILDENGRPFTTPGKAGVKAYGIEPSDLIDLKSGVNSLLRSNKLTTAGQAQLIEFKGYIQNALDSASKLSPTFGSALQKAEAAAQRMGVYKAANLKDIWSPSDYIKWKAAENNPKMEGYDADTVSRAGKFLDSLNGGDEGRIKSVIGILPREEAIQVLHDAILHAKAVTPSLRNVALNVLGKSGVHGTVGSPIVSLEQSLRSLIGAIDPRTKPAPIIDLARRASGDSTAFPSMKAVGAAGLGYLGLKSLPTGKKQDEVKNNGQPQSNNTPIGATNAALAQSKKNDGFQLSDLNPISEAEASEIKIPKNSTITPNVQTFMSTPSGKALQKSIKEQGANATEIMTLVNSESSVKHGGANDYGQMTDIAWKQAQSILGRTLNRKNPKDYSDAVVATYKWTADQVKKITGSGGTPSMKDVYPAYNAGISGFKALYNANPNDKSINVVPRDVAENNKAFYYDKSGRPFTVKETRQAYKTFVENKMNEYSPSTPAKATKLALNMARSDNEPDMEPAKR